MQITIAPSTTTGKFPWYVLSAAPTGCGIVTAVFAVICGGHRPAKWIVAIYWHARPDAVVTVENFACASGVVAILLKMLRKGHIAGVGTIGSAGKAA